MAGKKVVINPKILDWALQDSQVSLQEIEHKFKKFPKWRNGEEQPTFTQLKNLSRQLKVPFGYMFLKTPPNPDNFKKEFRTINNKINTELSKNLKDVLIDMEFKKNWMSDYRVTQGWEQIQFNLDIVADSDPILVAKELHDLLDLQNNWALALKKPEDAFNLLRLKIEELGIIVMINGVVGQNNSRTLSVKEFRAFALMDKYAPLIFINRNDSFTGMIFSLVHELIHLLIDNDDIITDDQEQTELEQKINIYVAEFLVPSEYINAHWNAQAEPINQINHIARNLKVSPSAVAVKLNTLNLIKYSIVEQVFAIMNSNLKQKSSTGGNYYNTLSSRLSYNFTKAVINQTESGSIRYTDAYRLLGINGKSYNNFKEHKEIQEMSYGN